MKVTPDEIEAMYTSMFKIKSPNYVTVSNKVIRKSTIEYLITITIFTKSKVKTVVKYLLSKWIPFSYENDSVSGQEISFNHEEELKWKT